MSTIHKLKKNGSTIFPATLTDAVVHPTTGNPLGNFLREYNVSVLFPTEGVDEGSSYTLELAITVLGSHLNASEKTGGVRVVFLSKETNQIESYTLITPDWSSEVSDWLLEGIDITQEAGDSEKKVMSQKAVTEYHEELMRDMNRRFDELDPTVVEGNVTNNADEEDLTSVNDKLKFKDKEYNEVVCSGLGRKYLRRNIIGGQNLLTQDMINNPNTVYIIQYEYDVDDSGDPLVIPENCTLWFQGGSIKGGKIILNGASVLPNYNALGSSTTIQGEPAIGTYRFNIIENQPEFWTGTDWVTSGNTNLKADEEDLTEVEEGKTKILMFKNREYSEELGLGVVYLRQNIVDGVNLLEQEMINQANTVYVVRYNYTLAASGIVVPEGCVLKFDGGNFTGGNLECNNTLIVDEYEVNPLSGITTSGTYKECTSVDDNVVAFLSAPEGSASTADFDAKADTVWNKAQTLSPTQKAQVRENIGATSIEECGSFPAVLDAGSELNLLPNVFYSFGQITSLRIASLGTPMVDRTNIYSFEFDTALVSPTVLVPSGITWRSPLIFDVSSHYLVTIRYSNATNSYYGFFEKW